jgi:predicted metal-binding membrane protein
MNRLSASPVTVAASVLAVALVAWIVTVERMGGMDEGPGADFGTLPWFLGVWLTMMAAMMLPAAAPMVLTFAAVGRERARRQRKHVPAWVFVGAYLAVWGAFGVLAYGAAAAVRALDPAFLAWDEQGPLVVGGAVVAAGLYELTPLKRVCLKHCRSPLHFVLSGWRDGYSGALRMGVEHALYCVGCCWGLMVVLFALGVMSILWMAIVAAVVFAQKVLPGGERLKSVLALALVALGVWLAVAPSSVPGFQEPGTMDDEMAQMR